MVPLSSMCSWLNVTHTSRVQPAVGSFYPSPSGQGHTNRQSKHLVCHDFLFVCLCRPDPGGALAAGG